MSTSEQSEKTCEPCCCCKNRVDLEKFYWKKLPVVAGAFPLRKALSASLLEKISIDVDLDQNLTKFENAPCTSVLLLEFGNSTILIDNQKNMTCERITLASRDNLYHQEFMSDWLPDCKRKITDNTYLMKYDPECNFNFIENTVISSKIVMSEADADAFMSIPIGILDDMRVQLENGEIGDYDGRKHI
jgi:hypothetical protein